MSDSHNNQNNPPSIDELINGEFVNADTEGGFNFDELNADFEGNLSDEAFFAQLNGDAAAGENTASDGVMTDDDAFFAELDKINASQANETEPAPSLDVLGTDTHANVNTSLNNLDSEVPANPLVDIPVASSTLGDDVAKSEEVNDGLSGAEVAAGALGAAAAKKSLFGKKGKSAPPKSGSAKGDSKGGLFAKKEQAPKQKAAKPQKAAKSGDKPANSNLLKYIIAAAIAAIVLLVGAWFLSQGEPEVVTPPPAPAQPATPPPPAQEPAAPAESAEAPAPTSTEETPLPQAGEMIDVDAIVNAEIPQDEALVKEEIDRLHDKDAQFKEQAQLIDEQLSMMEDLTKAKEEQIRLLEEQIAQLESQKSQ